MYQPTKLMTATTCTLLTLLANGVQAYDLIGPAPKLQTWERNTPITFTPPTSTEQDDDGYPGEPPIVPSTNIVITEVLCEAKDVANGGIYIEGTEGADVLVGTAGDDVINGLGGNDIIYGNGGDDLICAGAGDDNVQGGNGNDDIYGDSGNDILYGDGDHHGRDFQFTPAIALPGADLIYGGVGNDDIYGEGGNDTLYGDKGTNYIEGGPGRDAIYGGDEIDTILGNDGADTIKGNAGDDEIYGGFGDDVIHAGNGKDIVYGYQKASNIVQGFLQRHFDMRKIGMAKQSLAAYKLFTAPIPIACNPNTRHDFTDADLIYGGANGDTISGGPDGDCLYGEGGIDNLYGDAGQDYLHGGDDEVDRLVGGTNPPNLADIIIDPWGTDSITN